MLDMALHQILPAALRYTKELCQTVQAKKELGASCRAESVLIRQLSENTDGLYDSIDALRFALDAIPADTEAASMAYYQNVVPVMAQLRCNADYLEQLTDKSYWPYPTYSDLLFY